MDTSQNYWSNRVSRRGVLRGAAVGGAGLAGAALIGCGSSSKAPAPAAGNKAPAAGGSAAPAAEQPVMSEAFVLVQTRDAVSLEPLDANVYTVPERVGLVYPRILATILTDPKNPTSTKFVPSYAIAGMEIGNNGAQLTFKVKPGVKYANIAPLSGRDFTSEDIKYSLNRYMTHPKSTFQSRFSDISSMETPDKSTIVLKLKGPSRYVVSSLAAETALMTPPETDSKADGYKKVAIGPGPFIHDQYLQGEGSTLHKNPDFIDAKNVWYNKYLVKVITDAATRNAAMKTGQVDFGIGGLAPSDLKSVEGPSVVTYPLVSASVTNTSWNMNNPRWKDYRLRLAMSKAFDRQALIDQSLQGAGKWSGIVTVDQGGPAMSEEQVKAHNVQKYDPAEAKKLWAAAGGQDGMAVEYWFNPLGTTDKIQLEIMARQWKENLGINVTLKTEDYSIFLPKEYLGSRGPGGGYQDMFTTSYGIPNWMEHLFAPYLKDGNRNGSNFFDQKVTDMMNDLKATLDDAQAFEKSKKIQAYIWENHLPMTQRPIAKSSGAYNSKLRAFYPGNYPPGMEWMVNSWKAK